MRRGVTLILVAALLASCGDDGDDTGGAATHAPAAQPTATGGAPVAAGDALARAVETSTAAETFRGSFSVTSAFGIGETPASFAGNVRFRAPEQAHITTTLLEQPIEILVYGDRVYMHVEGQGWRTVEPESAGIDLTGVDRLWEDRGPFDLEELVEAFGDDIVRQDDATIDGATYEHYLVDADPADIAQKLPDDAIDPTLREQIEDGLENAEIDFYVDPGTELVRRAAIVLDLDLPDTGEGRVQAVMDFLEYNVAVEIPAEPAGAPPLESADFEPQAD
jgi:hypothetical protein